MSEITTGMRPTYSQIIDLVQDCVRRMHDAGESHRMLARWISEGLDASLSRPEAIGEGVDRTGHPEFVVKLREKYIPACVAGDVPDWALAISAYMKMDGFIAVKRALSYQSGGNGEGRDNG